MARNDFSRNLALAALIGLWLAVTGLERALEPRPPPPADPFPPPLRPDVNRAPASHLLLLPRIGPCRARAIVEERRAHGPFGNVDDLQRVRGIGPKTVAALRPLARAGGR